MPHVGEREPLRDTGGAVHLNRFVDDVAATFRNHCLDRADPDPCFGVAERVHGLCRTKHHQPHGLDFDAGTRHDLHVLAEVDQLLAEALAGQTPVDHHFDGLLGGTDGTHAMVDATRSEADLGDLEPAALAPQDVVLRDADIVESDVHMPVRGVVGAEDVHRSDDLDTRGVGRYQDLRLLLVGVGVGIGAHHGDHDLAARVAGSRDVELFAVDHPFVAVEDRAGLDLLGVGTHDAGLGHRVRRADLTPKQRLEPLLLLGLGADALDDFHVARVGRRTVQTLRREAVLPQFVRDVGVVEVAETLTRLGVRKEEVPQAELAGLGLGPFEQLQLTGRPTPTVGPTLSQTMELFGDGLHFIPDEVLHRFVQWSDPFRHPQIEVVHTCHLECATNHVGSFRSGKIVRTDRIY